MYCQLPSSSQGATTLGIMRFIGTLSSECHIYAAVQSVINLSVMAPFTTVHKQFLHCTVGAEKPPVLPIKKNGLQEFLIKIVYALVHQLAILLACEEVHIIMSVSKLKIVKSNIAILCGR